MRNSETPRRTTSARLKAALAAGGYLHRDVADWLAMPKSAVSARMSGDREWRIGELQTIARELGVPVADLIDEPADDAAAVTR